MSYLLFLDDVRQPKDAFLYNDGGVMLLDKTKTSNGNWEIVRNYNDFVKIIEERGFPSICSFDNDLCLEHMKYYINFLKNPGYYEWENFQTKSGIHCAKYLKDKLSPNDNIKVYVHSANEEGRRIIRDIMKEYLA
jgi:hypothetical protein